MATEAQINANRQNAQHSTGPRTEDGKARSSRNRLSIGLYTRVDFVHPEEREFYKEFCDKMYFELAPEGILEETLVASITGAAWRLRRCDLADGELADFSECDPLLDEATEKKRRSIERARTSAQAMLHRCINQLSKLQTERTIRFELSGDTAQGLVDFAKVSEAHRKQQKSEKNSSEDGEGLSMADIERLCAPPPLRRVG
jgi:hypothetical protein